MAEPEVYQKQLDTRALELAQRALTKVEGLEKHSDERYNAMRSDIHEQNASILESFSRLHSRIDGIFKYGIAIGASVIMLLLAVIGYLITQGVPWG